MSEEEELVLRATIRDELSGPLDHIRGTVRGAGRDAEMAGRQAGLASRGFGLLSKAGRAAGFALKVGFAGVLAAGYAATRLVRSSIGEAREAQKVSALTRAELKATGAQSWITAKQIDRLSSSISRKVGIDDEAIATGSNLLLTFKQVRNEVGRGNDVFNRATKAAVNLSAAGFGSIDSASKMLGKALNDPVKGMSAMARAGVTFTQQQQDTVKYLVEHNRLLDAQKLILGEVESQVNGAAAAQATWGDKASVMWGNIQERIGMAVLPLLDRVEQWFVQRGGPALDRYVDLFENRGIPLIEEYAGLFMHRGVPAIKEFVDRARPLAESVLPAMGSALGTIRDVVSDMVPKLTAAFDGFNNLPDWAKQAIVLGAGAGVVGTKLGVWKTLFGSASGSGGVVSAFTKARPMPVWVVNNGVGTPGLPGTPSTPGGPKIPPVIPGLASGGWRAAFSKFGGLGLGGLLTGVTLADRHPDGGWGTTVNDLKDWDAIRKQERADAGRQRRVLADLMGGYEIVDGKAKASSRSAQAMAQVSTDAFGTIYKALTPIIGGLDNVTRPRTATVRLDGVETAMARLDAFRSKLDALDAMNGGGGSVPIPYGSSSDQLVQELTGGGKGGGKHGGGKHDRPVATPHHAGRATSSGTVIADGAFPTTIQHRGQDLDPAELRDAWEQFLTDWLRDREEAGAL